MLVREALKGQYHAGLAMLNELVTKCPPELWEAGRHPRPFWRVAFHTIFFTHLYMQPSMDVFEPWPKHRDQPEEIGYREVEAEVPVVAAYSKEEILEYLWFVDDQVNETLDRVDLDSPESGFYWYHLPKLDHQMMNTRHLQQHVGQLSERLLEAGIDQDWMGRRNSAAG